MQAAFAAHLRHVRRTYPAAGHKRVVLLIDNAPWHAGGPVRAALADNPHLELKRLPAYSPQPTPIDRIVYQSVHVKSNQQLVYMKPQLCYDTHGFDFSKSYAAAQFCTLLHRL